VPDDSDYEWLGWLVNHPEKWTESDLSSVRDLIAHQKRAMGAMHPRDEKGRRSAQKVIEELEAAIEEHLSQRD
jgi:hypothetical protein